MEAEGLDPVSAEQSLRSPVDQENTRSKKDPREPPVREWAAAEIERNAQGLMGFAVEPEKE